MAKKRNPQLDLHWLLYKKDYMGKSKISGSDYWRLYFLCYETKDHAVIDVDASMKNFGNWKHIVESDNPWGVYTDLKKHPTRTTRNWGDAIITADSTPECNGCWAHDEVLDSVEELCAPPKTKAQELFDFV